MIFVSNLIIWIKIDILRVCLISLVKGKEKKKKCQEHEVFCLIFFSFYFSFWMNWGSVLPDSLNDQWSSNSQSVVIPRLSKTEIWVFLQYYFGNGELYSKYNSISYLEKLWNRHNSHLRSGYYIFIFLFLVKTNLLFN